MQHVSHTKNIQAKSNQNVLAGLNNPQQPPEGGDTLKPSFLSRPKQPLAPNQKKQPIRVDKKIGRNDKVTIKKGSETKTIKYKKFDNFSKEGWQLTE